MDMKCELKKYLWKCDCCKVPVHSEGGNENDSRPKGWITAYYSCGDFECRGDHESDYCAMCVNQAKKSHKKSEDNHFGTILRFLDREKKRLSR